MEARREALLDIIAARRPRTPTPPRPTTLLHPRTAATRTRAPYQPAYGSSSPYAVVQVSHPKATTAMVFGILGIVLGVSCGLGGLLGIAGIVQGRRARDEIDAQPGRYAGRSQAVAGIVTGTIGVVIAALVVLALIAVVIGGIATGVLTGGVHRRAPRIVNNAAHELSV